MRIIDLHCYPGTAEWIRCQGPYVEALASATAQRAVSLDAPNGSSDPGERDLTRYDRLGMEEEGYERAEWRGLLRPGFHSGMVPALYRKLRAAVRRAERTGRSREASHGRSRIRVLTVSKSTSAS